jgi:hypothetical protein
LGHQSLGIPPCRSGARSRANESGETTLLISGRLGACSIAFDLRLRLDGAGIWGRSNANFGNRGADRRADGLRSIRSAGENLNSAWGDCIMDAVIHMDDGKTDPVSLAYGIAPQCAGIYQRLSEAELSRYVTETAKLGNSAYGATRKCRWSLRRS